jgi:hypothetical protein
MGIPPTDTQNVAHNIGFRIYDDNTLTTFYDDILWTYTGELEPGQDVDLTINRTLVNLTDTSHIALIAYSAQQFGDYTSVFTEINLECSVIEFFDGSNAIGYLNFEVGQRVIESISDRENVFESTYLGKTENGYPSDGEAALYSNHSGKQIRGLPNETPSYSLSEWFKSMDSIFSIGLGIEYNEVNQPFIRVEEKKHFFNGQVIATIHNVREIKKEVAREWIYNEVQSGYAKAEYEEVNGLEEYNNKFDWATRIGTIKNKLDLVSKIRADGYGIEFARRLSFAENPTEDSKYDNDNFIVNVARNNSTWRSVRNENYDFVQNIFSPDTAYNLDITPGRNLRRHGYSIRA